MRRIGAGICFGYFLCLVACCFIGFNFAVALGAVSVVAGVLLLVFLRGKNKLASLIPLAGLLACVAYCLTIFLTVTPLQKYNNASGTVTAVVEECPCDNEDGGYLLYKIKSTGGITDDGVKMNFYIDRRLEVLPGDIIEFEGTVSADETTAQNLSDGIYMTVFANGYQPRVSVTEVESPSLYHKIVRLRLTVADNVFKIMSGDEASVVNAMTFGSKYLSDELYALFKTVGVPHLFAVSGLHIGIIGQIIMMLLGYFGVKRRISAAVSLGFIWLFVALIGFPASAMRAAIMFTIYAVGLLVMRRPDALNSLAIATAVICVVSPLSAANLGLLSSVLSCLGLILLSKPIYNILTVKRAPKTKAGDFILSSLSATIAAICGIMPCTVLYFGTSSIVTPISNLLMIPLSYLILFGSVLGGLFGFVAFLNPLSRLCYLISGIGAKLCLFVARALSGIPCADLSTGKPYIALWVAFTLILVAVSLLVMYKTGRRKRTAVICLTLSIAVLVSGIVSDLAFNGSVSTLVVCDVGDGMCLKINSGSHTAIIGVGGKNAGYKMKSIMTSSGELTAETMLVTESTTDAKLQNFERYVSAAQTVYLKDSADEEVVLWDNCTVFYNGDSKIIYIKINATSFAVLCDGSAGTVQSSDCIVVGPGSAAVAEDLASVIVCSASPTDAGAILSRYSPDAKTCVATAGAGSIEILTRGQKDITARRIKDGSNNRL